MPTYFILSLVVLFVRSFKWYLAILGTCPHIQPFQKNSCVVINAIFDAGGPYQLGPGPPLGAGAGYCDPARILLGDCNDGQPADQTPGWKKEGRNIQCIDGPIP